MNNNFIIFSTNYGHNAELDFNVLDRVNGRYISVNKGGKIEDKTKECKSLWSRSKNKIGWDKAIAWYYYEYILGNINTEDIPLFDSSIVFTTDSEDEAQEFIYKYSKIQRKRCDEIGIYLEDK